MPFGHVYVDAPQADLIAAMGRRFAAAGLTRVEMKPEFHPVRMQQGDDSRLRLFWVAPRLGRYTGLFEFRYYDNAKAGRFGFTDEPLARWLSGELRAPVYRLEVLDNAGFWLYARYERGEETDGGAYEERDDRRSADPAHPRYALNRILEREGIRNVGLAYENIPGPQVRPIEGFPQSPAGIEGLAGFVHAAYAAGGLRPL